MKNIKFLFFLIILYSCSKSNFNEIIKSPDNSIQIRITLENAKPFYEISCDRKIIIKRSSFSFSFKDQPSFGDSLTITDIKRSAFDETWKPVYGTSDSVRNHYNEACITLRETGRLKRSMQFIARAYNDGIAFRYDFIGNNWKNNILIKAENTCFNFPANDSAWWIPSNEFAYESLYRHTPLSKIPDANTPITIETASGFYISMHEAELLDYSEMVLRRMKNDSLSFVSSLWPEPDSICARVASDFKTPWRCIMIGRKPGDLIESHIIENLNEPCAIKDVSWIKPMKFIGIWWGMHIGKYTWFYGPNHGATTERAKKYIDFAYAHHIGGFLAEGWNKGWETWASGVRSEPDYRKPYPDFNLEEVVKYAKEKNVEFISHHETGGNIPAYEKQLDDALALCRRLGISYLKTGYAGPIIPQGYHHHGQYMVRHFQKVVEAAAKYHISIDVHETIKPTGLTRTWPNLMTQEGARGNEWNATYKATPPYHCTILPFTRFLAGPYDYTPGIFHIIHSPEKNKRLYCTLTYQLALYVVFYSPMMMVSDMIENYENKPAFGFIEDVPCIWDQTKVITAKLGHYVSIARRNKDKWYVGSVVDENCHLLKLPLSFLPANRKYVATIYGDSITTNWENNPEAVEVGKYNITSIDTIYAAISKAGGHAVIIAPAEPQDMINHPSIREYNKLANAKMKAFEKIKTFGVLTVKHLAVNKPVSLKYQYSELYPASGKNALTDGIRGTFNYSAGGWQGFEGVDMDAIIDLQKEMEIQKISAGFLNSPNDWIFYPKKIEFFISSDGKDFKKIGEENCIIKKPDDVGIVEMKDFTAKTTPIKARFIRVEAHSILTCPAWHPGSGKKAWLFCDEILVN